MVFAIFGSQNPAFQAQTGASLLHADWVVWLKHIGSQCGWLGPNNI